MNADFSRIRRPRHPMPAFIRKALEGRGLMQSYVERPAYQQNDYIGWITRAKRPATRQKRLDIMLGELAQNRGYMGTWYRPRKRK